MALSGKRNGTWYGGNDQSAGSTVYGKYGGSWLYAKSAWAKKDGVWKRAWTDCRQLSAGGRDWIPYTETETITDTSGCDSCGSRTGTRTRTRYEKTGCPTYYSAWSAYSYGSCSGSWNTPTSTFYITRDGFDYYYFYEGTPGYFKEIFTDCRACAGPVGEDVCFTSTHYYVTQCSITGEYRFTYLSCDPCTFFYSGQPC